MKRLVFLMAAVFVVCMATAVDISHLHKKGLPTKAVPAVIYRNPRTTEIIRLSDGLSRDTQPRKSYDQALMDGIKQAILLLKKESRRLV